MLEDQGVEEKWVKVKYLEDSFDHGKGRKAKRKKGEEHLIYAALLYPFRKENSGE